MLSSTLANIYFPSFIQFITGPLLWSIYGITLIFTIPLLLLIGFIEALVLRRYTSGVRLWTLTWRLAFINAITSLIGTYFTWPGTNLWPGLMVAFLATSIIEGFIIRFLNPGIPKGSPLKTFMKGSMLMNTASYSVMAVVLTGLIYIPPIGHESERVKQDVQGTIFIRNIGGPRALDLNTGRYSSRLLKDLPSNEQFIPSLEGVYVRSDLAPGSSHIRECTFHRGMLRIKKVPIPKTNDKIITLSPDKSLFLHVGNKESVVTDMIGQHVYTLPQQVGTPDWALFSNDNRFLLCAEQTGSELWLADLHRRIVKWIKGGHSARFNPAKPEIAWLDDDSVVFYDCIRSTRRTINVPGTIASVTSLAWSPDGKYIAYLGSVNPFTYQHWTPDIRVISIDGTQSATIQRELWTAGWTAKLFWLK